MSTPTTAFPHPSPGADEAAERSRSGRHRVDVAHLVMGLVFLCFTGAWALVQSDAVSGESIRWLLPVPWLVAGAAGLAVIAVRSVRRTTTITVSDTDTDTEELR